MCKHGVNIGLNIGLHIFVNICVNMQIEHCIILCGIFILTLLCHTYIFLYFVCIILCEIFIWTLLCHTYIFLQFVCIICWEIFILTLLYHTYIFLFTQAFNRFYSNRLVNMFCFRSSSLRKSALLNCHVDLTLKQKQKLLWHN